MDSIGFVGGALSTDKRFLLTTSFDEFILLEDLQKSFTIAYELVRKK